MYKTKFVVRSLLVVMMLMTVVAWSATPATTSAGTNLVTNGDFGSGTAYWNWSALAGTEGCCSGGGPLSHYPDAYAHPNGSNNPSLISAWENIPNPQAGNYTLSGYIITSGGAQQAMIQADDGTGNPFCRTTVTNTTGWQQFSCTFSYPQAGFQSIIHVALLAANGGSTGGGWINWDDISLTMGSSGSGSYLPVPFISQYQGLGSSYCDCGPTSVAMILRYKGILFGFSNAQLVGDVRTYTGTPGGTGACYDTGFGQLETAIAHYGLSYSEISNAAAPQPASQVQAMQNAVAAGHPVIALVHGADLGRGSAYGEHWVVVTGFSADGQTVYLNDPDNQGARWAGWIVGGQITLSRATFSQAAYDTPAGLPYAIIVY